MHPARKLLCPLVNERQKRRKQRLCRPRFLRAWVKTLVAAVVPLRSKNPRLGKAISFKSPSAFVVFTK